MKHLIPLVMMQLKDKIDFSFLRSKKSTITKVVFTLLGFIAVVFAFYMLYTVSVTLHLFSQLNIFPVAAIVVLFTLMFVLSCISCTFGLMKTMYFSTDNQVLLTLPVKANQVFLSKLIVYYIYEFLKNFYFIFPMFIAYGLYSGFSILFYPWLIICFAFITLLPVLIGAILSIPLMFITSWLKQLPVVKAILLVAVLGGVVFVAVKLISIIPENINLIESWPTLSWQIQDFLKWFAKVMLPFAWLVQLVCGKPVNLTNQLFSVDTILILLGVIAASAVLFLISFYVSRPLFFKMASKPFEYKKRLIRKTYKNKFYKPLHSGIRTNVKTAFRTSDFLYNYVGILIVLPIAILLLNKIFNAMNTKLLGLYMTLSFNILMMLLILLASNVMISSLYSKEGRSSYYFKTMPKAYTKVLFPKLVFSLSISFVSVLTATTIFAVFAKLSVINSIMCFLFIYLVYVGHLFWSAELDLMNPQNEQYATTGTSVNNPNEKKSTLYAFILAFVLFVISLLLFTENIQVAWLKLMLIAGVFAAARVYLYFGKIRVFYKEK